MPEAIDIERLENVRLETETMQQAGHLIGQNQSLLALEYPMARDTCLIGYRNLLCGIVCHRGMASQG